jgi:hypothetical protein
MAAVLAPESTLALGEARCPPASLLEALVARQLRDQPGGQTVCVGAGVEGRAGLAQLAQAALQAQEALELVQPVAAGFQPVFARPFCLHVCEGALEIAFQVDVLVRDERQPEHVPGHWQVDRVGGVFRRTTA